MNAIVSVTSGWGIGNRGELIVSNREDMAFFRRMTTGGTVICGQTTYLSFPHGVLPNRRNIVISDDMSFVADDAFVVRGIEDALAVARDGSCDEDRIWVIGGASIYRQMLPMCDRAYVTFHDVVRPADAFFPNLDDNADWTVADVTGEGVTGEGIPYEFRTYERVA